MMRPAILTCAIVATVASSAFAQPPELTVSLPPSLVIPNYHRVLVGQREGIEANAYVARSGSAASGWFNPAGLAKSEKTALDASASAYEWNSASVEGVDQSTARASFGTISTIVAAVIAEPLIHSDGWRLGGSYTTPVSWQPAAIDDQFLQSTGGADQTLSYYSKVAFTQSIPAAGVGMKASPTLRFGAGLGVAMTHLSLNQAITNVLLSSTELSAASRLFGSEGTVYHALFTGGMQWDFGTSWTMGATVTTPGLRVMGSTLVKYEASGGVPGGHGWLTFRDEEAKLDYRIPITVATGLAWTGSRSSIEADVRFHGATDSYTMIESSAFGTVQIDTLSGTPPVVGTVGYQNTINRAAQVVSVAVGGHYEFSPSWVGHLGFYSDPSPVADPNESMFRAVDLIGVTGGVTLQSDHLSGSLGLGYSSGKSDERPMDLALGTSGTTRLKVTTISVTYALSYKF